MDKMFFKGVKSVIEYTNKHSYEALLLMPNYEMFSHNIKYHSRKLQRAEEILCSDTCKGILVDKMI